jgi:4-amino-4-deoxy-L-arabinose transferase-like glycosyltransferase
MMVTGMESSFVVPPDEHEPEPHPPAWIVAAIVWVLIWSAALFAVENFKYRDHKLGWTDGMYGNAARALLQEGFVKLRGGVYVLPGDFPLPQRDFYAGHPPLLTWMLAGWMKLFGQSDLAIRAFPLTVTAIDLLLLYILVSKIFTPATGFAAMAICSVLPMTAFYAQLVNFEWFVTATILAASLCYLRYVTRDSKFALAMMFVFIVIGCWIDWPMYIFSGLLAALHWLGGKGARPWKVSIAMILVPVLMFGAFVYYLHIHGSGINELLVHARVRSGVEESGAFTNTNQDESAFAMIYDTIRNWPEFMAWFGDYFTLPAMILAVIAALTWRWWAGILCADDAKRKVMFRILVATIVMQLIYALAFPNGAIQHEFWQYYLVMPAAICIAGLCVGETIRSVFDRSIRLGILDRGLWAVVAMIPLFAIGPMVTLLKDQNLNPYGPPMPDDFFRTSYAAPLKNYTTPKDAIFTDHRVGYALSWYAERMVFYKKFFLSMDELNSPQEAMPGSKSWIADYSLPGTRLLYLWEGDAPEQLYEQLQSKYGGPYKAGPFTFFVLNGSPGDDWQNLSQKKSESAAPAEIEKMPDTKPMTMPSATTAPKPTPPDVGAMLPDSKTGGVDSKSEPTTTPTQPSGTP